MVMLRGWGPFLGSWREQCRLLSTTTTASVPTSLLLWGTDVMLAQQLAVMPVFKNKVGLICQIESGLGERF